MSLSQVQPRQTLLSMQAALSPIQSVPCVPDSGHVYAHEVGSIENTGHKLVPLPSADGTITAEQIRKAADRLIMRQENRTISVSRSSFTFPSQTSGERCIPDRI